MQQHIKAIILDIGNVLVDFCYDEFLEKFAHSPEEKSRLIQATVESKDWCELDKGLLTEEEILDRFIANDPQLETEIRNMYECMEGILRLRTYAIPFISQWKEKGYQVIALSNLSHKLRRECAKDLAFETHLTSAVFSYEEQCIKPHSRIYEILLERYQLCGQECVFIDDLLDNIQAASKLGFHTVHFRNYEQMVKELEGIMEEA